MFAANRRTGKNSFGPTQGYFVAVVVQDAGAVLSAPAV